MHLQLLFVDVLAHIKKGLLLVVCQNAVLNFEDDVLARCQALISDTQAGLLRKIDEAVKEEVLEGEALSAKHSNQACNRCICGESEGLVLLLHVHISVGDALDQRQEVCLL